jgi:aspartate racemase
MIGIVATDGTIAARLFHNALESRDITGIAPDSGFQKELMEAIYGEGGIKQVGEAAPDSLAERSMQRVAEHLIEKGAEGLIAGCTEVALGMKSVNLSVPLFDTLEILAKASAELAMTGKTILESSC